MCYRNEMMDCNNCIWFFFKKNFIENVIMGEDGDVNLDELVRFETALKLFDVQISDFCTDCVPPIWWAGVLTYGWSVNGYDLFKLVNSLASAKARHKVLKLYGMDTNRVKSKVEAFGSGVDYLSNDSAEEFLLALYDMMFIEAKEGYNIFTGEVTASADTGENFFDISKQMMDNLNLWSMSMISNKYIFVLLNYMRRIDENLFTDEDGNDNGLKGMVVGKLISNEGAKRERVGNEPDGVTGETDINGGKVSKEGKEIFDLKYVDSSGSVDRVKTGLQFVALLSKYGLADRYAKALEWGKRFYKTSDGDVVEFPNGISAEDREKLKNSAIHVIDEIRKRTGVNGVHMKVVKLDLFDQPLEIAKNYVRSMLGTLEMRKGYVDSDDEEGVEKIDELERSESWLIELLSEMEDMDEEDWQDYCEDIRRDREDGEQDEV